MKRWIHRILFILLLLLLIYAAVVLVILYTDLPRNLILKTLSQRYALKVTVDSMQISPGGQTNIQKLSISLPMEDTPVLTVPKIIINHTKIPLLLFNGFKLKKARLENPIVNIRQEQTGIWNIQRLLNTFQQKSSEKKRKGFEIPDLEILNGTAIVSDKNGENEKISPIVFESKSSNQNVWDFQGDIASMINVGGRLAQSIDLSHEVNIKVNGLPEYLKNLIDGIPEPLKINAKWNGSIRETGLSGILQIENAAAGSYQAKGSLEIQRSQEGLAVNIEDLLLNGFNETFEQIKVSKGTLQFDGKQLKSHRIFIDTVGNKVSVTGNWDIEERRGDFYCSLNGEIKEKEISYENTLSGIISWPENGNRQINLFVNTHGQSPWGVWQSNADLVGSGENWFNSQWHVTVPSLKWSSENNNIQMTDVKTEFTADWPVIKFDNFEMGDAQKINAQGQFSADTNNWAISFEAEDLKVIEEQDSPFDLKLIANGNMQNIAVEKFSFSYNDLRLEGDGKILPSSKELSDAHAKLSFNLDSAFENEINAADISGNIECETEITGQIWPLNLQLHADLSSENVKINQNNLEPIKISWQAQIDTNEVIYNTDQFKMFDGNWSSAGRYDFAQRSTQFTINNEQVSLQPAMQLFDLPIKCRGLMKAGLDVNLPIDNINQMIISGNWAVNDMNISPIEAKSAKGRIIIQNGTAVFDQIELIQDKGGKANAKARFRLDKHDLVSFRTEAQNWLLNLSNKHSVLVKDANTTGIINLANRTVNGSGYLSTSIDINDNKLADVAADIVLEERRLNLNNMKIKAFEGHADGNVLIPIDNWTGTKANLNWQNINIGQVARFWPESEGFSGISSGSLVVSKAEGNRVYEPLHIEVQGTVSEGNYRSANLSDYRVSAYLGKKRLLIDYSEIEAMNGIIKTSGNIRQLEGEYLTYMNADFSGVEINQLLHIFLPEAEPVLGNMTGKGMLVVFSSLHGLTGDANILITDSDLAKTRIVSTLYDTMNLKLGENVPKGQGKIRLRFEGSSLQIPSFEYFNRGVEIRGGGTIADLTKGRASPVKGYAVGSARPLKGINLLGINELDRLMSSLQNRVASIKINGTLGDTDVQAVTFREISDGLRALLWNQLHK
ncbi:MAG: hypothetical protein JW787_07280 [Sedimentisphaerales bacterium]|nr:hypothetical protein [Sedimentisphaerales bacterium]